MATVLPSLVVVAVLSLPFLVALAVNPTIRRLAWRHPRRRPVEAVLVVLGSMLGTAIITGSLVVGDAIDRSIRASAYEQLGPIDEVVTVAGLDEGARLVRRVGPLDAIPGGAGVLDGLLAFVATPISVVGQRVQPRAQLLEVDFEAARRFGADPSITGIDGPTPLPGRAAITRDLATTTDTEPGDPITLHVFGQPITVVVDRVLDRKGIAGYWTIDARQQSYNVLVTPGSLAAGLARVELPPEVEPPQTVLAFSNVGDVEGGLARTGEAARVIGAVVGPGLAVQPVKQGLVDQADATADALSEVYITMGAFSVAAGVLLLVNIFVMLADERRSQLGMMRALGMRRSSLVLGFATEGWFYALVSSGVGAVLGIWLGQVITWRAGQILDADDDLYALRLTFSYERTTVVQGLAAGFVIALVTIVLTSIRVSRLNVIAAIRDLSVTHGPRRSRRRLIGLTSLVTGLLATVWSLPLQNSYLFAVGPMLVAVGVGALVATHVARRATVTGVALVVLAWGTMVIPVLSMLDVTTSIAIFVVQGFAMCAAAVALVTVHQKALGMWLSARFGGSMPVRVGLAYPVAKASRTALTLGMFALVVLTIVYISFIGLMFREQVDDLTADLSGGFGIVVTANPSDPPTDAELRAVSGVTAVAPLAYGVAPTSFAGQSGLWPVTGFGAELVAAPPVLKDRGGYATDGDAWQAVLDDPTLVIVDEFLLNTGGPVGELPAVGDTVTLADPASGDRRELTVAALAADDYLLNGAFYGLPGYRTLFGDRAVPSRFFVGAADPDGVSRAIGLAFVANGAEAVPVRSSVDAVLAQTTGFFGLMKQFVGVGLLVGIAGLGVVLVRSVRERRRDIGVLRAIGLERRPVTGAFLLEGTFVAAEGVVLGVLIALVGTWGLVLDPNTFMPNLRWTVPWRDVITVSVVTLVAAALTAAVPARRAGRIRPAQALRIVD